MSDVFLVLHATLVRLHTYRTSTVYSVCTRVLYSILTVWSPDEAWCDERDPYHGAAIFRAYGTLSLNG